MGWSISLNLGPCFEAFINNTETLGATAHADTDTKICIGLTHKMSIVPQHTLGLCPHCIHCSSTHKSPILLTSQRYRARLQLQEYGLQGAASLCPRSLSALTENPRATLCQRGPQTGVRHKFHNIAP